MIQLTGEGESVPDAEKWADEGEGMMTGSDLEGSIADGKYACRMSPSVVDEPDSEWIDSLCWKEALLLAGW
jgi:hypothetical protein